MNAAADAVPRSRRWLSAWIAGDRRAGPIAPPAGVPEAMATMVGRQVFADIGEFVFAHQLSLTATSLDIGLRYVSGGDPAVVAMVGALCREHGRLTDAMVERVAGDVASRAMSPEFIHRLAERLQRRLDECVGLVARSSASASSYGDAFDAGMARLDAGHADALSDLSATARDLVRTTRDMQGELDRHRHEASRLRSELQRARRDAERDHLTGLPNRRCFDARVKAACRPDGAFAIALCDIDDFKSINDEHGHSTGDRVLRLVGAHLERELKGKALVARHGGEEFALFFRRATLAAAVEAVDGARERLAARALVDQESNRALRRVTFSAGVALLSDDVDAAMRAADHALYRAKHDGKNRVVVGDAATA